MNITVFLISEHQTLPNRLTKNFRIRTNVRLLKRARLELEFVFYEA